METDTEARVGERDLATVDADAAERHAEVALVLVEADVAGPRGFAHQPHVAALGRQCEARDEPVHLALDAATVNEQMQAGVGRRGQSPAKRLRPPRELCARRFDEWPGDVEGPAEGQLDLAERRVGTGV